MSDDESGSEETGFDPGQAADSMVSGIGDFFGSALDATENLGMAALDMATMDGALVAGFGGHVEAGVIRAFGGDELADTFDARSDQATEDAHRYANEASEDLDKAWDAVAGEDETLFK